MSIWLDDRVQQTSTTAGTGNLVLDGTVAGQKLFLSTFGYNSPFWYLIEEDDVWEKGIGQLINATPGPQLQRLIFRDSSSGTPISFTSATKTVSASASWESFGPMSGIYHFAVSTGTAAAYTLAVPFPILTYYTGLQVTMLAHATCNANATLSVSGLAASPIRRYAGTNVLAGDIRSNQIVSLRYDGVAWVIDGFSDSLPANATASSLNGALFTNVDQPVLNPDFSLWQRGTSASHGAGGGYTYLPDRWVCFSTGTASFTRSTDTATGFQYSIDITNGSILQNIESLVARNLIGKTITITVCAKRVTGSGNFDVALSYAGAADNFSSVPSIGTATLTSSLSTAAFAEYKATFNNLPANVANGLRVFLTATGQYRIAWVKIEEGTGTPGFKPRHPALELMLCQRYYEISRSGGTSYASSATNVQRFPVIYKTLKRTSPTVTIAVISGSGTTPSVVAPGSENGFLCGFASSAPGIDIVVEVRADAEL